MRSEQAPAPAPEYGPAPQYPIDSVDNALRVLLLLNQRPSLRLTEVSRHLGVASSTAHRLLATLQFRGFVQQDATRSYTRGPALDEMAMTLLRQMDVRTRARPILEQLNASLRETIHLGRLDGTKVHFVEAVESTQALRVGSRLGWALPAHCTSTGKALLAALPVEEVRRRYPDESLPQLTAKSIATRTMLLTALAEVRARGFAASQEESEEGVSSVAVALPSDRQPRYAVNAAVPASRMSTVTRKAILARLTAAAAELDAALG